jgi:PiT family inorganic phosphate transporter
MIWIIAITLGVFLITYIGYQLIYGKRQSALKESSMYKRLQLLSSAAFSLGHGGADSQKVMGIICAACIVYAGAVRNGDVPENSVPDYLQVAEVVQIKYKDDKGKIKKFKPTIGVYGDHVIYQDGKDIIDMTDGTTLYDDEKLNTSVPADHPFLADLGEDKKDFKKASKSLEPLLVYTEGKKIKDYDTEEIVFEKKAVNKNYRYAAIFSDYVDEAGELKEDYKLESKVNNETMPYWIALSCYLMIGIGTLMGGWKIVKTMGTKITKVTPLEGVCAETAGALTLFTVSQFGIPVSTTHTITGSIIGVGATKRLSAVRWGVTINLLWAWILTIPVSGLLAAIILWVIKMFI